MFPRLWERAVAYFQHLLLTAFQEAERRADATIAQRFETQGQPVVTPPAQPTLPPPQQSAIAAVASTPQVQLPPLPPVTPATDGGTPDSPAVAPKRPRGRPRKESPK